MPALRLFGRKWLAATDDLVFPCLFEICFRIVWLALLGIVVNNYFITNYECTRGGLAVRIYLCSVVVLIFLNIIILIGLVNRSAQGSIAEAHKRHLVSPLLVCKVSLILPEIGLNVFGSIWAFCNILLCNDGNKFSKTVVEAVVIFNWVLLALSIFGLAIVFDPLGSTKYKKGKDNNDNGPTESALHRKLSRLWLRRFRWIFCCLRKDEYGNEAFTQVASLLSALFRGTDLVPSDVMAGCILMRVRQKRETREMRRIRMLNNDGPRYSTDLTRLFATTPQWMTLKNARHFMRFALASYGWPLVCYMHCCTGPFSLIKKATCCACFRSKSHMVIDDNCCMCHVAGVKYMSRLRNEDVLHASFKNHVFEVPYCILADHSTKSIVLSIRGSLSMRDIFTDLTATAEKFEAFGISSESSYAHRGMIAGLNKLMKKLRENNIIERAFNTYPEYSLVITGHSLGAGIGILLGLKLRPKYPDIKVYAFGTPAGLLSREAARYTELFAFSVGVGDDFVMRLGVESIENLRTSIIETIRACKLPKYRIMLNGFGYALFGVPSRDLETTWRDVTEIGTSTSVNANASTSAGTSNPGGQSPLLGDRDRPVATIAGSAENAMLSREFAVRRFSKIRLYNGGRILHIVRRKKTELEKKSKTGGPTFEMRWASAEEFTEFKIMPRMLLDHLPDNIYKSMTTILEEQKIMGVSIHSINEV